LVSLAAFFIRKKVPICLTYLFFLFFFSNFLNSPIFKFESYFLTNQKVDYIYVPGLILW
jgi:hypothetical protein